MIYVGTCGYSYKDWIGAFYPAKTRQTEMLQYYTRFFRAVEIDTSYYGIPRPAAIERMIARTPAEFRFCFKVPRTLTHPPDPRVTTVHPDAAAFVQSIMPVIASGKFGAALLQFPNAFKPTQTARTYLRAVIEALAPLTLVAEFRNHQWQNSQTLGMLAEHGVGWCNVDMPRYESLMRPSSDVSGSIGYVRFHGRNAAQWWKGDNTTRYDYDYAPQELEPWLDRVAEIEQQVEVTFAFFNNHARGNAARNAEMFIDLLRGRYGGAADEFVPRGERPPVQRVLFG